MSDPLPPLAQAGRLWRTVRHLKPVQVTGRIRHKLWHPPVRSGAAPARAQGMGRFHRKSARRASLIGPETFDFLGEPRDLRQIGWVGPDVSKLWRYNQHYFDDLHAAKAGERRSWHLALMQRWITENPPGKGDGWEPYPISLRLVNWAALALQGMDLPPEVLDSMATQARHLMQRLEWHLLGNHLYANAKALLFVGLLFEGDEAKAWQAKGAQILLRETEEQILADGGHFERSTMYHALALEDVLDLLNLLACRGTYQGKDLDGLAALLEARAPRMLDWLAAMCHPDEEISFFNDAAFDIAPAPAELFAYAGRLGLAVPQAAPGLLQPSGYARLAEGSAVVLADVAPVGPDYLPGHAHADTLSFEMSLWGKRLVVNSGTSVYGEDLTERQRQRGTPAHSTLVYDGQSSSEIWSAFRTGRRPRVSDVRLRGQTLTGAHDGYAHLPGRPMHRRGWHLEPNSLTVDDRIDGALKPAHALFHLAPGTAATQDGPDIQLTHGPAPVRISAKGARLSLGPSTWHPRFGESVTSTIVIAELKGPRAQTTFSWSD